MDPDTDPCPYCGASLPAVMINVEDNVVTMRSCSHCDLRWWTSRGETVDPTVLFAKQR